ncbi:MAG: ATPase, T2SS/T4P/T4SS family [Planctomycetota bacterium]
MTDTRRMMGEILIDLGCVTEEDVDRALELQMDGDERKIGEILMTIGGATENDIVVALAEQYEMEIVSLDAITIDPAVVELVKPEIAREHKIMPVEIVENTLIVAISDPMDLYALDQIRFVVNMDIEPVLSILEDILSAQDRYYGADEERLDQLMSGMEALEMRGDADDGDGENVEDAPIIKLANLLILEAVKARASDIHIEPMANRLRVRYRVDGVCYEVDSPPKRLQAALIARVKIMSRMDMSEKRRPQDGRIKLNAIGKQLDFRVSSLPASHGESVVLRILDKESISFSLESIGFHSDDVKIFNSLIRKPNGVLLITGPTGSGKTTTLYTALNELNTPDRKIITAENPVEYMLPGINQCQVREEINFTFQRILRAMLRQAPNIILVGEIRDSETAEIAIQAALTGHLVFSTLHTNDAPSSITRLIDMGVAAFLVASSIQAVQAQRLIRMICPNCKTPVPPDEAKLMALGLRKAQWENRTFYKGAGCDECRGTGFKGRKGIFEIMVMNNRIRELAFNLAPTDHIRKQARQDGMNTLLEDGIRKVLDGWTTVEQILAEAKILVE